MWLIGVPTLYWIDLLGVLRNLKRQRDIISDITALTPTLCVRVYLHQVSASMLWQLCDDASNTVVIQNNRITSEWVCNPTPLFSIRTVSLASSQSCCGIDTDAWCKRALKRPLMCKVTSHWAPTFVFGFRLRIYCQVVVDGWAPLNTQITDTSKNGCRKSSATKPVSTFHCYAVTAKHPIYSHSMGQPPPYHGQKIPYHVLWKPI